MQRQRRSKHRGMGLPVVLLLACGAVSAHAAAAAEQQTKGRKLKQLTLFYETPAAAGSTSVGVNARAAVRPDGTFHAAGGTSYASSDAFSNPFIYWLTDGAYKNRPQAASTSYNQIPLALQSTQFPTLSYGLAEGRGDALSTSNGAWGTLEFGYNPLSNNLGTSISSGTTDSLNVGANERIGSADPKKDGVSGVEFAGYSNDLTNLADARTDQSGQAIAFPNNLVSPLNPLTCTQSLLYGLTLSNYDLGAPVTPVPREDPGSTLIPYCLQFFNFGTLDDFAAFVDGNSDYELNFDNNGDGRVNGLRGRNSVDGVPGGRLFNRPGNSTATPANSSSTTTTTTTITAPPVVATSTNREQRQRSSGRGHSLGRQAAGALGGRPHTNDGGSVSRAADRPVPRDARARAILPQPKSQKPAPPRNFAQMVDQRIQNGPPELKAFAQTKLGSQLIDRYKTSPAAHLSDASVKALANAAARGAENLQKPVKNVREAVGNFTEGVVLNTTNLVMKSAVAALETAEPLFRITKMANDQMSKVAGMSSKVAADLAKKSSQYLQEKIAQLPEGKLKQEVEATAAGIRTGALAKGSTRGTNQAAQMGRRRMLGHTSESLGHRLLRALRLL